MPWRSGNPRENKVAQLLRDDGYFVSSRRHEEGPGDLLALADVHFNRRPWGKQSVLLTVRSDWLRPLLVEVKGTLEVPWSAGGDCFGPDRRADMIEAGVAYNLEPMLCWWPPHYGPIWLPVEDWPA